jgi:lipopolysaccharide export system permease protein
LNRISVLLLKSYVGPFIITFVVAMFIFEMQFIWVYLDELVGKGLSFWIIAKLLFFASARVVNMALPLAILMSGIMTLGALGENNELTAMKSSGISLMRILRPLIVFSILLAGTAFVFANNLWPVANLKCRTILFNVMKQKPSLNLTNGVFYNGIEGISIRVDKNDPDKGELTDVLIYDHRGNERGNRTVIRAESGLMEQTSDKRFLILTLFKGYSYDEQSEKKKKGKDLDYPNLSGSFDKSVLRLDLSSLAFNASNEDMMKNPAEMMTAFQLADAIDSLENTLDTLEARMTLANLKQFHYDKPPSQKTPDSLAAAANIVEGLSTSETQKMTNLAMEASRKSLDGFKNRTLEFEGRKKNIIRHKIEMHRKFFLAVVCIMLFFVGAPLGAIIRKGGIGMPTMVALALFIFYQLLTMTGENMAKNQIVPVWFGMWVSSIVFLPLSIMITYKATKEAVMLGGSRSKNRWSRILAFFKSRKKKQAVV